ncbi:MAG: nucleotidyltransferase family protein [Candidatus Omnitrophica bacterium]|nr:nucleotidyltransferase family protein [Candidatus Omnitrophota bacterium]MCA9432127.1 nucleotidyltransferase family protein [Candidatus Omnitrophota bacterium]MCA9449328.1 nucleotidyltransferase family protein [Candidatus Omnitrophota bacterium]
MAPRREEVFEKLEANREEIQRFHVRRLGLFGSTARGEQRTDSDLDFLVEFDQKTFRSFMGLKMYLEDLFGCKVDLATEEMLKERIKPETLREVVHAKGF